MQKLTLNISLLLVMLVTSVSHAAVERRKDQFGKEFAYYLYPIAGEIPGLGTALGVGASVLNLNGSDTDFTGYYVSGDFDAKGAAILDYHLIPKRLIFDAGYNDYFVASTAYDRGVHSAPDEVIRPKEEGAYLLGQLTYTHDERRYEFFVRALSGRNRLHEVLDKNGAAFAGVDTEWQNGQHYAVGGTVDLTDDRLDPRQGVRLELALKPPPDRKPDESKYYVTDYNLSGYIPLRQWDTLVFNL
ncbi:MAG: hypothetical protein FD130_251, partial [Halothiobacillaceae bacterium]